MPHSPKPNPFNPRIQRYISLLKTYNATTNIYSQKAYDQLDFHVQDCINLAEMIGNREQQVLDMGSGSGLPSIILAIMNPLNHITAVESKQRKTRFLHEARDDLGLDNLTIVTEDLNVYARQIKTRPEIITAKAFAPYPKVVDYAKRFSKKGSCLYVPISRTQKESLSNADDPNISFTTLENDFIYFTYRL